jgi:hypothetical protein
MINYRTKVTIEYTNKKWDLNVMKIKIKNLEKIIPYATIATLLSMNLMNTKSGLDAYYLTYYELKDMFLKYKRSSYGDTAKNIKKVHELNWEDILNEQLINPATTVISSKCTNASVNNSIYGYYNAYDNYLTNKYGCGL